MKVKVSPGNLLAISFCATAVVLTSAAAAMGQDVQHLSVIQPGGMPGLPMMTGIEKVTNGVKISWDGPSGYYQLLSRSNLAAQTWQAVGGPNASRSTVITNVHGNAFFRVSGPSPQYAGATACGECHGPVYSKEAGARHATAYVDPQFVARGGQTNSLCQQCHTVGFGLPSGFVSGTDYRSTNLLAGVQCENCHGPAANHAATPDDLTVKPRIDVAATVCGGCHAVPRYPTYLEWQTSGHAQVTEPNMNPNTCGRCHIGAARIAMVKGEPVDQSDTGLGVVCAVCHDPHGKQVHANVLNGVVTNTWTGLVVTNTELGATYSNQVRNPFASTKDYFLTTSDVFTNKYDPNINVCAQCHNHRGADWRNTSRAPHHSPQYNILLGTIGELAGGSLTNAGSSQPASHALIEKQCAGCHMQTTEAQDGPPQVPAVTGHTFTVDRYDACRNCHPFPAEFVTFTTGIISNRIQQVKTALDQWALVKQGGMLGTNYYGALAWEYTNPGDLSTGKAPTTADQALIPDNIKKARFNLYLVLYDGSLGVHNGRLSGELLDAATAWIQQEMLR